MASRAFLKVGVIKDCPIWEVVEPIGIILRSSPDTRPESNTAIETFSAGLLIERVDDIEYPDLRPGSTAVFFKVVIGYNPLVYGFVAARITDSLGIVDHLLLQTVSALAACRILGTEQVKACGYA